MLKERAVFSFEVLVAAVAAVFAFFVIDQAYAA